MAWVDLRSLVVLSPNTKHTLGRIRRREVIVAHAIVEISSSDVNKEAILSMIAAGTTVQHIWDAILSSECLVNLTTGSTNRFLAIALCLAKPFRRRLNQRRLH